MAYLRNLELYPVDFRTTIFHFYQQVINEQCHRNDVVVVCLDRVRHRRRPLHPRDSLPHPGMSTSGCNGRDLLLHLPTIPKTSRTKSTIFTFINKKNQHLRI